MPLLWYPKFIPPSILGEGRGERPRLPGLREWWRTSLIPAPGGSSSSLQSEFPASQRLCLKIKLERFKTLRGEMGHEVCYSPTKESGGHSGWAQGQWLLGG